MKMICINGNLLVRVIHMNEATFSVNGNLFRRATNAEQLLFQPIGQ